MEFYLRKIEKAIFFSFFLKVELALDVEGILPQFIRRKFVVRSHTIAPNTKSRNPLKRLFRLDLNFDSTSTSIVAALNPELVGDLHPFCTL